MSMATASRVPQRPAVVPQRPNAATTTLAQRQAAPSPFRAPPPKAPAAKIDPLANWNATHPSPQPIDQGMPGGITPTFGGGKSGGFFGPDFLNKIRETNDKFRNNVGYYGMNPGGNGPSQMPTIPEMNGQPSGPLDTLGLTKQPGWNPSMGGTQDQYNNWSKWSSSPTMDLKTSYGDWLQRQGNQQQPQPFNPNPNPVSNMGAGQLPNQQAQTANQLDMLGNQPMNAYNQYQNAVNATPQQTYNGQLDLSGMMGQQGDTGQSAGQMGASSLGQVAAGMNSSTGGKSSGSSGSNASYGGGKGGSR